MAYPGVDWENKPSTRSPINAANLEIMDNGIKDAHDFISNINETIKFNYGYVFGVEQNGWSTSTGADYQNAKYCRTTGYIDKRVIVQSNYRMYLFAYNKNTNEYIGYWNGTEWSRTWNANKNIPYIVMHDWVEAYPDYVFKIMFNWGSNITPSDVLAGLIISDYEEENLKELSYGTREFGFVQGSRSLTNPLVIDENVARVVSRDPIVCKKGDIISVSGTYSGIKFAIGGRTTDNTTYNSGYKTEDFSYKVAKDGNYYVIAAKTNGTDAIIPSEITFTATKINKTYNGNVALEKVNNLEPQVSHLQNYVGETDVFNFKEDNGYALNYTTPLKYSNFKVKIDKVSGNHTTFSIRVKYNSGTATVLKSGCEFGKEYDIETDLTQYNNLMIYQSAPSSHPIDYNQTSYNLNITGNATLNGRVLTLETDRSVLQGKKIVMLGDSITQLPVSGNQTGKGIVEYVAELTGATVIRGAFGGSKMQAGDPLPSLPITNMTDARTALNVCFIADAIASGDWSVQQAAAQYAHDNGGDTAWVNIVNTLSSLDYGTVDAITLFAGTNDFNAPLYLGNEDSNTIFTYCGAINHIIETLYTKYPKLTIYVFTPIVRHFVDSKTESTAADFSDNYTNSRGDKLTDYVAGAKATAYKNHIPCLDTYNLMGWNLYNFWQYFPANDGTHPRNNFDKLAMLISRFMLSNWNR